MITDYFSAPWKRLKGNLGNANIWLVIALLTLAGWSVDALWMFLEMHQTFSAGLGAFASHFWYAVPMILAVVVLTRLKTDPTLLGVAIYDETGRLIEREGDFYLDELTEQGMLAALRDGSSSASHSFQLPSGASVYFVREGGRTLVLSFSGPVSSQRVASNVERWRVDGPAFDLLQDLEPPVAALAANLLASPLKRRVLIFLRRHSHSAIQSRDLAYWVDADEEDVGTVLEEFLTMGLLERERVCGLTFYRPNQTSEIRRYVDTLFRWRFQWQTALEQMENVIGREPAGELNGAAEDQIGEIPEDARRDACACAVRRASDRLNCLDDNAPPDAALASRKRL